MTVSERMSNAGLVPVVVLENAADAVPTALSKQPIFTSVLASSSVEM